MRKLTLDVGGIEVDQSPPAVFERRVMSNRRPRIVASVADGRSSLFRLLTAVLPAPFYVLYILHTTRGEGEPGRYQSTELSREDLEAFLRKYEGFFSDDGRHDLWVYSPSSHQTLIWDRHNTLFAEGEPLGDIADVLVSQEYHEGSFPTLGAHFHHYRPEYDGDAASLLNEFDWHWTSLREEDVQ
jgi:hypothetical protein